MANYKVWSGATGGATGADWANAFTTLAAGIAAATALLDIVEVADGVVLLVALAWFDGTATTTHHAGISRIIAMTRLIVRRRDVKFIKQIGSHLARLCIVAGATARSRGAVVLAVGFGGLLAGDTRRAGRGCIGLGQRRDQSGHRIIRR